MDTSKDMARKKRHTAAEIAAKLEEAANLEAGGRSQKEIARHLGVSVMTFHRWRKMQPRLERSPATASLEGIVADLRPNCRQEGVTELRLENSRLRRLVTDLLLGKIKLEHDAPRTHGGGKRSRAA